MDGQKACQACTERTGALDRERTTTRRVLLGELQCVCVAVAVRVDGRLENKSATSTTSHRSRARASRGADQRRRRSPAVLQASVTDLQPRVGGHIRCRSGDEDRERQDCDGSHPERVDRLLIRPASGRQAGTGLFARTNHWKDTHTRGHSGIESRPKSTDTNLANAPDGTHTHSQIRNDARRWPRRATRDDFRL